MNSTKQILEAARSLLEKPENWTKGCCARDKFQLPTHSSSLEACSFCMVGAINRAGLDSHDHHVEGALGALESVLGGPIAQFNDNPSRTHAEILNTFDEAIKNEG